MRPIRSGALLIVALYGAMLASSAQAQRYDNDLDALQEFAAKLPAVTEVLGQAMQNAQDCRMAASDMQGTQHAYFTILSTSVIITSLRTLGPEVKKLWPTEASFRAAYQHGQDEASMTAAGRPADFCAQVRAKYPPIDAHEEEFSRALAARLKALKERDDAEADARIKAGHAPTDGP